MSNISLFYEGKKIVQIVKTFSCTLVSRIEAGNLNFSVTGMHVCTIINYIALDISREVLAIIE